MAQVFDNPPVQRCGLAITCPKTDMWEPLRADDALCADTGGATLAQDFLFFSSTGPACNKSNAIVTESSETQQRLQALGAQQQENQQLLDMLGVLPGENEKEVDWMKLSGFMDQQLPLATASLFDARLGTPGSISTPAFNASAARPSATAVGTTPAKQQPAKAKSKSIRKPSNRRNCPHGRQKYLCAACGGGGICVHGVQKHGCKKCGLSYCKHGRVKSQCRPCGGSAICVHNKRKSLCRTCGGGSFCEHDRLRYRCKVCKRRK